MAEIIGENIVSKKKDTKKDVKKAITKAVLKAAKESKNGKKKLSCKKAFKIAEEFGVKPIEVGKICNKEKVKFINCQLGCF